MGNSKEYYVMVEYPSGRYGVELLDRVREQKEDGTIVKWFPKCAGTSLEDVQKIADSNNRQHETCSMYEGKGYDINSFYKFMERMDESIKVNKRTLNESRKEDEDDEFFIPVMTFGINAYKIINDMQCEEYTSEETEQEYWTKDAAMDAAKKVYENIKALLQSEGESQEDNVYIISVHSNPNAVGQSMERVYTMSTADEDATRKYYKGKVDEFGGKMTQDETSEINEINENTMKQKIKLNEGQLRQIIKEAVIKTLNSKGRVDEGKKVNNVRYFDKYPSEYGYKDKVGTGPFRDDKVSHMPKNKTEREKAELHNQRIDKNIDLYNLSKQDRMRQAWRYLKGVEKKFDNWMKNNPELVEKLREDGWSYDDMFHYLLEFNPKNDEDWFNKTNDELSFMRNEKRHELEDYLQRNGARIRDTGSYDGVYEPEYYDHGYLDPHDSYSEFEKMHTLRK